MVKILSSFSFKKGSGVKIQIKSEITPDAAGQNAGLSSVTRQGRMYTYYGTIIFSLVKIPEWNQNVEIAKA